MVFETREQVLEKVMAMDKPRCPHCNEVIRYHCQRAPILAGSSWSQAARRNSRIPQPRRTGEGSAMQTSASQRRSLRSK